MTATTPTFKAGKAWLVAAVVIIAATFAAIVTFRQMTVVPLLTAYFGIDVAEYGNVSAIVSLFTLVGALASGPLQVKIGPRMLMIVCFILFLIGTGLQTVAALGGWGFIPFMGVNIFATIAYGAWMTAPPIVIAAWFPAEKRGLPNSINATWISFGMLIVLTVSQPLVEMGGDNPLAWLNIWYMLIILMIIGLVILILFARMPKPDNDFMEKAADTGEKAKMGDALKNPAVWFLMFMFIAFGFGTAAFGNYFPTYLQAPTEAIVDPATGIVTPGGGFGVDPGTANTWSSWSTYVMIIVGFLWGFVLNAVPNKHYDKLNLFVMIVTCAAGCIMFVLPSAAIVLPFMIFWGFASRLFPPVCFVIVPEVTKNQEEASVAVGAMAVVSNLIGTIATSVCGMIAVGAATWNACLWPNVLVSVIGIVCAVLLMPIYAKKYAAKHSTENVAA